MLVRWRNKHIVRISMVVRVSMVLESILVLVRHLLWVSRSSAVVRCVAVIWRRITAVVCGLGFVVLVVLSQLRMLLPQLLLCRSNPVKSQFPLESAHPHRSVLSLIVWRRCMGLVAPLRKVSLETARHKVSLRTFQLLVP
jgi:hypothetical protein